MTPKHFNVGDPIEAWNRLKRPWRGMRNKARARVKRNKQIRIVGHKVRREIKELYRAGWRIAVDYVHVVLP